MIRAEALSFAYPGGGPALDAVSFALPRGALCGVVGANGSGKSTLLALLAGLFAPTDGALSVGGHAAPAGEDAIRRLAALVLQDPDQQIIGATVEEDLLLGLSPGDAGRRAAAEALAARFGLSDRDAPVHTLSLGSRRKLCIVTALRDAPELLLLDEPFAGLDGPGRREAMSLLVHARRRFALPIVLVSHAAEEVSAICDATVRLEAGRVAGMGPTLSVLRAEEAEAIDNHFVATVTGPGRVRAGEVELAAAIPPGAAGEVRLACFAHDIILAAEAPRAISARNCIPTRIEAVLAREATAIVTLAAPPFRAAIGAEAAAALGLRPGREVVAVVAETSIAYLGGIA